MVASDMVASWSMQERPTVSAAPAAADASPMQAGQGRPPVTSASPDTSGSEPDPGRSHLAGPAATNGLSDDEVAAAMMFSPTAAKTHVSQAMTKLGARDRAQLVVFACQSGLVIRRTHAGQIIQLSTGSGVPPPHPDHHADGG
jgi:Bacterial regulatory proteins, luxR family